MADPFHEDFLDFLLSVNFPTGNIISLHVDYIYESIRNTDYTVNATTVPGIGMGADISAPFNIKPPPNKPKGLAFWSYNPVKKITTTTSGGAGVIVDRGEYIPRITYVKNGKQQSALITVESYHGLLLPVPIDHTGDTSGGAFTDAQGVAILANIAALFAGDFGVGVINQEWVLTTVLRSHPSTSVPTTNTHIDFKTMMFFDTGQIKRLNKNAKKFDIKMILQGQLASGDVNCSWNISCATWKKTKTLEVDGDFNPIWAGQLIGIQQFSHTFNETTIPNFTVTFDIDLKTLQVTGTSNG